MKGLAAAGETTSQLVESYFAAEMRRDARRVLEHFCDDAALVLPDGRSLVGREAIGTFYSQVTKLDVRVVSMLTEDGLTAVEWEASVVDEIGACRHYAASTSFERAAAGSRTSIRTSARSPERRVASRASSADPDLNLPRSQGQLLPHAAEVQIARLQG